jgi:hypothetical protein
VKPPTPLRGGAEIDKVKAALLRHEAKVSAMDNEWSRVNGSCCPGCMFGGEYTDASEQVTRTGRWLGVLLRKRGTDDDLRLANAIEIGAWP